MTSIKKITTFLASLVVASILLNTTPYASIASAQQAGGMYCVSSYEQLVMETQEKELLLAFVGITRTGMPLWFFANSTNFSVFFKDRITGNYCTAPNYFGNIIDITPMPTDPLTE
jgi:hypothetical protein